MSERAVATASEAGSSSDNPPPRCCRRALRSSLSLSGLSTNSAFATVQRARVGRFTMSGANFTRVWQIHALLHPRPDVRVLSPSPIACYLLGMVDVARLASSGLTASPHSQVFCFSLPST